MEHLCAELRARYGVERYPVDVRKLAEGLGVRVRERAWKGLPHSLCVVEARLVVLNSLRPVTALRFDLAHELGHFVFMAERYHKATENGFAAELLMPARGFRLECLANGGPDAHLAGIFGVSLLAVKKRANELLWRG